MALSRVPGDEELYVGGYAASPPFSIPKFVRVQVNPIPARDLLSFDLVYLISGVLLRSVEQKDHSATLLCHDLKSSC